MNAFDAVVVLVSFGVQLHYVSSGGHGLGSSYLGLLRMVRLLRIFVVMNKIQRQRDLFKRKKQLKGSSALDRVLEIFDELKLKLAERSGAEASVADIEWTVNLIVSEKLYKIDLRNVHGGKVDGEMNAFLMGTMGLLAVKNSAGRESVDESPESAESSGAGGGERAAPEIEHGTAQHVAVDNTELERVHAILDQPKIAFADLRDWDIDVFGFHSDTSNSGLVVAAYQLFESHGLVEFFGLNVPKMALYFRRIQEGYRDNPYHNCVHALDVMLNTSYFISQPAIARLIRPIDRLAAILAAAIHDYDHPGLNNQFLVATRHEWAIKYSDQSVLESHHVASAWAVLLQDKYNFISALKPEVYRELRELVIELIQATDMAHHFALASKLKTRCSTDSFSPVGKPNGVVPRDDIKFLLCATIHAADISNGLKSRGLCLQWVSRVMEEFFRQGDLEATLGMRISPFYDRGTTSISQCQKGFLNIVLKPYFDPFCNLLGAQVMAEVFQHLLDNINDWETQGDDLLKTIHSLSPGLQRGS